MAESGDGEHQDTVDLCHFADGAYEAADAPESDFYGPDAQGHGRDGRGHRAALRGREPAARRPVVVRRAALGRPRPGDPRRGVRRGAAGAGADPRAGEEGPDLPRDELGDQSLRLRGARDRQQRRPERRPPEPHGPRVPADGWGDIIPPYEYLDKDGKLQTFQGYNWSEAGQAIYENGCEPPAPPTPKKLVPLLECVEQLDGGKYLAHWGYENKNDTTVEATGDQNTFSPGPADRGQPTAFAAGRVEDALPGRVQRLRAHLVAHRETRRPRAATRRSVPAARSRSRSGSSPRATPAASRCGSTARSAAAPRPSATAGRRERSPSRRAAAR